jgi:hypothetical protein
VALGLFLEIADSVDVVGLIGEERRVVDAPVLEFRDAAGVIAAEAASADD